jgi:soluble lytic murein transglycosylase-like protein
LIREGIAFALAGLPRRSILAKAGSSQNKNLMSWNTLRTAASLLALTIALPAVADAQIYVWRDASGNMVLSDKAKDPSAEVKTYAVAKTATFKTTNGTVSSRATKYDALIEESATFHGVDANLVRAVIQQESGFNPRATSRVGAMGLMQLMPATAEELGVTDPYNPMQNIRAGVSYLKGLLVKFSHNVELALAAYNAGAGAVRKYGNVVPPYRETKDYVKRITKAVESSTPPKPATKIYRTLEIVNGHPVVKLTTVAPREAQPETPAATRPSMAAAAQR